MSEINPHFSENQARMQKAKKLFREEWLLERISAGYMAAFRLHQRFQGFGLKRFWFYCAGTKASTRDPSIGLKCLRFPVSSGRPCSSAVAAISASPIPKPCDRDRPQPWLRVPSRL